MTLPGEQTEARLNGEIKRRTEVVGIFLTRRRAQIHRRSYTTPWGKTCAAGPGAVRLLTRTGLDWTPKYPAIAAAIASLPARQAYPRCFNSLDALRDRLQSTLRWSKGIRSTGPAYDRSGTFEQQV